MTTKPLSIGVLISGSGSNLQALIDARDAGELPVDIRCVVSSRPDAYGLKRATAAGIPTISFDRSFYADAEAADLQLAQVLREMGCEWVVMAGYMRMVGPAVLTLFENRVLNLHPALLPAFPGAHAIRDAHEAGVKLTGVTVHIANAEYDRGPIVAQRAVEIAEGMTLEELEEAVHRVEHELYPQVVALIAQGRVEVGPDRHVHIREGGSR